MRFVKTVAQLVEFAGYGPCGVRDAETLLIQWGNSIREYKFNGKLYLGPVHKSYQNSLSDVTKAVLNVILDLPGNTLLSENVTLVSESVTVSTYYLWLVDPKTNLRRVIHEVVLEGHPVWVHEGAIQYDMTEDPNFWTATENVLRDFLANGFTTPDIQSHVLHALEELNELKRDSE